MFWELPVWAPYLHHPYTHLSCSLEHLKFPPCLNSWSFFQLLLFYEKKMQDQNDHRKALVSKRCPGSREEASGVKHLQCNHGTWDWFPRTHIKQGRTTRLQFRCSCGADRRASSEGRGSGSLLFVESNDLNKTETLSQTKQNQDQYSRLPSDLHIDEMTFVRLRSHTLMLTYHIHTHTHTSRYPKKDFDLHLPQCTAAQNGAQIYDKAQNYKTSKRKIFYQAVIAQVT